MKLYIAGGCGEHGRNCFHVEDKELNFLVDCGLMAGEEGGGYPHLKRQEILSLDTVFLTHSHADHTGAVPWLYEQGFSGQVVASRHTLEQLPFTVKNPVILEEICPDGAGEYRGAYINWGHSGHCVGSVWYRFETKREMGKSILFSGDYTEDTQIYDVQPIRNNHADLAVLDCAYGKDQKEYDVCCYMLIRKMSELLNKYPLVFLPVPKYGRGLELFRLFQKAEMPGAYYGDEHFLKELDKMQNCADWYKEDMQNGFPEISLYTGLESQGIVFVSNPQLRTEITREIAKNVINRGGYGVMTGTVEPGTFSEALLDLGKMEMVRYPVHQNLSQYERVIRKNMFGKVIPYHTPDFDISKTVEI